MVFFYLVLILHFCCFRFSKNLFPFSSKRTAKLRHFFELTKYFKKNIYFFLFNHLLFNSQATSLDCGCKVTAFSETTKIFLNFFANFFLNHCIPKRKIFNILVSFWFIPYFLPFFCRFYTWKICFVTWFFRVFGFFRVFSIKTRIFHSTLFYYNFVIYK